MGLFVTFEGIEGSGKTTQIGLAEEYLDRRGMPCLRTEEPGGAPLGRRLRELLLNRAPFAICPEAELLLFAAARAQHVREAILPALAEGKVVLCDRFADATAAYQGYARGLDMKTVDALNAFAMGGRCPDLTLLFDLPVEMGLARARRRIELLADEQKEDRFEAEELSFHQKVREGYLLAANREPKRFRIIDATGAIAAMRETVCLHLDRALRERERDR
ncbi:MAG: dTMP kinase [Pseudomonadota bacterium]|nr:dTMP kinase [Pseudomonadota bacterium]